MIFRCVSYVENLFRPGLNKIMIVNGLTTIFTAEFQATNSFGNQNFGCEFYEQYASCFSILLPIF